MSFIIIIAKVRFVYKLVIIVTGEFRKVRMNVSKFIYFTQHRSFINTVSADVVI